MQVCHGSLRLPSVPLPRRVDEGLAEGDAEADVVAASAPLEAVRRRLVGQRTAVALPRQTGAACLRERLRQSGRRQRVE